jgi:hypothetical protein
MRRPADTRGAELHLVLVGLHVGDQLFQIARRQAVAPHQHGRHLDGEHDRDEIGNGIVGRLFEQRLVLRERIHGSDDERVAVGSGAGRARGADRAAGAADVLDDDLLAEQLGHARGQQAADDVDAVARPERHDRREVSGRPFLGRCGT